MRVLHVIPWVSPARGGPSRAIADIERALSARGLDVTTVTTDDGIDAAVARGQAVASGAATRWIFPTTTGFYTTSWGLGRWLRNNIADFDIVHAHAVFSFAPIAAAYLARARGVPYVIRPFGVLNPYGMTQRRPWLKRLSLAFVDRPALENAGAVHFTSLAEQQSAGQLGLRIKGVVIPLGIDVPASPVAGERRTDPQAPFDLLFLSRLSPVKNLESLLRAVALLAGRFPRLRLTIAGSGDAGYEASLKDLARVLNLGGRVTWRGFVEGPEKANAFGAASAFVLPSFSESFGLAAVEALAASLPCVVTEGVAIAPQIEAARAGIVVAPTPEAIAGGIAALMQSQDRLRAMSAAARQLASDAFSLDRMGQRLEALYRDVVSQHHVR